MEDAVERRRRDWREIVEGLGFESLDLAAADKSEGGGSLAGSSQDQLPLLSDADDDRRPTSSSTAASQGIYSSNSFLFVAGDLNYRTSNRPPNTTSSGASDLARFPQKTAAPDSPAHFSTLLQHDQLTHELKHQFTLHGLSEAAITFPPTYKLRPPVSKERWNWAPHRFPSWCDRILFRAASSGTRETQSRVVVVHSYDALPQLESSDHRPVYLSVSIPKAKAAAAAATRPASSASEQRDQDAEFRPPYEVRADWKARRAAARRRELLVGLVAYFFWTWEGNGLLLASVVGGFAGYVAICSVMDGSIYQQSLVGDW